MILFKLYRLISFIIYPLTYLYLCFRLKKGKEDKARLGERIGNTEISRPEGYILWIHAASLGEVISVLPLTKALANKFPHITILFTSVTVTASRYIKDKLPANSIHQFLIVDNPQAVDKFLSHWQPNLALWTESEFWPNIIYQTAKLCPIISINTRISENSYSKWLKVKSLAAFVLSRFSVFFPQSKDDLDRIEKLGAKNIHYIGNLKYSSPPLNVDIEQLTLLQNACKNRRIFVAASTHTGEEIIVIKTHNFLKQFIPNLLTIIVPRHVNRSNEIEALLTSHDIEFSFRSKHDTINEHTEIYIADTIGELGIFYSLAEVALIGGTFVPIGGHNPIEAAHFNCAILMGPYHKNFTEICSDFTFHNAMILLENESDLAEQLKLLFTDDKKRNDLADASRLIINNTNLILIKLIDQITPYINGVK